VSTESTIGTRLYEIAKRLTGLGIAIVPAYPGDSQSYFDNSTEQATTRMYKVGEWMNQGYSLRKGLHVVTPDHNWVCIAKSYGVGCLDIDDPHKCKALGMPALPGDVFTVDTAGGKGLHIPFVHTDETRALGNVRNVYEDPTVKKSPLFEFKGHNQPWCGPWQQRHDGGVYKPRNDQAPLLQGLPADLIAWIVERSKAPTTKQEAVPWKFYDEETLEDFLTHNKCTEHKSYMENGRLWVVPDECPLCGRHSDSTGKAAKCKFIFGGRGYGFTCKACGVEGGGATQDYEDKMQEVYPDWDPWDELLYAETPLESMPGFEFEGAPADPPVVEITETLDPEPSLFTTIFPNAVVVKAEPKESKLRYPQLRFPYEALPEGRLKDLVDKACEGGLSPGLVCPAILALISSLPFADSMEGVRVNLFVNLLALVGAGKDTAIDRAIEVLGLDHDVHYTAYSPSGERSVSNLLADHPATKNAAATAGLKRHVIVTYELEDTLKKSRGETSSVLQILQWLYDHNRKTFSDSQRQTKQTVDCRLSWLTALPVGDTEIDEDIFRHAWGENSSHGMASRMLFGFSEERFDRRKSRNWSVPHELYHWHGKETEEIEGIGPVTREEHDSLIAQMQKHKVSGFAPGVEDQYLAWNSVSDLSGRDTYHVLKVAVLVALADGHTLIEQPDWDFAVAFMLWQSRIRQAFAPGKAKKVNQGQFNETVIREIEKRSERLKASGADTKHAKIVKQEGQACYFVRWRAMANSNRWHRYGMNVEKTVATLVKDGALAYLHETSFSPDGKTETEEVNDRWVRLENPRGGELV
jgi:hypothetical protein